MAERGGRKDSNTAAIAPNFFDLIDAQPALPVLGLVESKKQQTYIRLLNALQGYDVAQETLRHYPEGPVLIFNGRHGDYALATRSKKGWDTEPLVVGNLKHLKEILGNRSHKKVAGVVVYLMERLNAETQIYLKQMADNLEAVMHSDYRFFVTFVATTQDKVPTHMTGTEKKRLRMLNPNHGSFPLVKKLWFDSSPEVRCWVLESESLRPQLSNEKRRVSDEEWTRRKEAVGAKRSGDISWFEEKKVGRVAPTAIEQLGAVVYEAPHETFFEGTVVERGADRSAILDFSGSFTVELDKECGSCGLDIEAIYRDGSRDVQVGCSHCGHPAQIPKSQFVKRFGAFMKAAK